MKQSRPKIQTEATYIRYSPELRDRIDEWRGSQKPVLSRADAMRRLIEEALDAKRPKPPKKD